MPPMRRMRALATRPTSPMLTDPAAGCSVYHISGPEWSHRHGGSGARDAGALALQVVKPGLGPIDPFKEHQELFDEPRQSRQAGQLPLDLAILAGRKSP